MRTLASVMLVLAVWCEVASAKPKVAILGLELIVSGAKADPKALQVAAQVTEALRAVPRSGKGKYELAPGSNRELIDEKLAANCETEQASCMAPIGAGRGADYLIYGSIAPVSERGRYGFRVDLKLLNVSTTAIEMISVELVPPSGLGGDVDATTVWAQLAYAKLIGELRSPPADPPPTAPAPQRPVEGASAKRGDGSVDGAKQGRLVDGSLTLGNGKLMLAGSTASVYIARADDDFDEEITLLSFAPSIWYGITDKLTLGVTHDAGTTPWTPRASFLTAYQTRDDRFRDSVFGLGLCAAPFDNVFNTTCPKSYKTSTYNSLGADILYSLARGRLGLVAHSGIDTTVRYPFVLDVRIGVLGRYVVTDRFSIVFEPQLRLGTFQEGLDLKLRVIDLPVWSWFTISDRISVYLHAGVKVQETEERFGSPPYKHYAVPLQLGLNCEISRKVAIGVDLGLQDINYSEYDEIQDFTGGVLGLRVLVAP